MTDKDKLLFRKMAMYATEAMEYIHDSTFEKFMSDKKQFMPARFQ